MCSKLREVIFADGSDLHIIGTYAFAKTNLETCMIPQKVTCIGDRCFFGCENLRIIGLPTSLTEISSDAFAMCLNLKYIIVTKDFFAREEIPRWNRNWKVNIVLPSRIKEIMGKRGYSKKLQWRKSCYSLAGF